MIRKNTIRTSSESSSTEIETDIGCHATSTEILDPWLTDLLSIFASYFGTEFSNVRIYQSDLPIWFGAEAVTCGAEIFFAPGKLDPGNLSGLLLLGHELVHVIQQRVLPVCRSGFSILWDPVLEYQAEALGQQAALFALQARSADKREQECPKELVPYFQTQTARVRPINGFVQCKIEVGGEEYETDVEPLKTWGLNPSQTRFYKHMLKTEDRTFYFADRNRLLKFVKDRAAEFENTDNLTSARFLPYFDKIVTAEYSDFEKRNTNWSANINVRTKKGHVLVVHAYVSVKRHLISSFMQSQMNPRDRKEKNVVVKDDALFEQKLIKYARHQASEIKANQMLFGYNPHQADSNYQDPELKFATDITYVPSGGWAFENPIHCFPESGTAVKDLSQEEYHALVTFLLWFFRTEEHKSEGEKFDRIKSLKGVHSEDKKEEIRKSVTVVEKALASLKASYGIVLPVADAAAAAQQIEQTWKDAKAKPTHYNQLLGIIGPRLYTVLSLVGEIPAVNKPYILAKNKHAGIKAESRIDKAPEVRFKTHKVEVKAQLKNLSPAVIAWAIDGYTTTSAADVLIVISASKKVKAHVNAQISAAAQEAQKNPPGDLKETLEKTSKLVSVFNSSKAKLT